MPEDKRVANVPGYALPYAIAGIIILTSLSLLIISYSDLNNRLVAGLTKNRKATYYGYQAIGLLQDTNFSYEEPYSYHFDDNFSIACYKAQWGFYDLHVATVLFDNSDTLFANVALVGQNKDLKNGTALYLKNNNALLRIGDNINITGDIYCPSKIIKTYFSRHYYYDTTRVYPSPNVLPILTNIDSRGDWINKYRATPYKDRVIYLDDSLVNSFKNGIQIISSDTTIINGIVRGYILIHSKNVLIKEKAKIQDAVIICDNVTIASGFVGSAQLFVSDTLIIGENVTFSYPSILTLLPSGKNQIPVIRSGDSLCVIGEIFAYTQDDELNKVMQINIGLGSIITGGIYSTSMVNLTGKCYGRIYASTIAGNYIKQENLINDLEIFIDSLPDFYSFSKVFPESTRNTIVQWLEK